MADITQSLHSAMQLSGAIAVALVDVETGMTLGTQTGAMPFNIEAAAAANTEVVRSKMATLRILDLRDEIEDILITLKTQYHLIRLYHVGTIPLFLYLALDRNQANLALARMKLTEIGTSLAL